MSDYSGFKAKHKASGRYGVVDAAGQWLANFLGTKDEAISKAELLNSVELLNNTDHDEAKIKPVTKVTPVKQATQSIQSSLNSFVLTKDGWLHKGEN